jgi:hypothetical protein
MHPGRRFLWGCSGPSTILTRSPQLCQNGAFQFYLRSGKQRKVGWVENDSHVVLVKNSMVKEEVWDGGCSDATASSFVAGVRGEVFAHYYAVAAKRYSSIRNWLFGLPECILSEQSPWCQGKLWACSWLCSSPVLPFSVSMNLDMPFKHSCTAHVFFPERLFHHCQGLRRTFSEICTTSDAVPLSDP